jgi:hypothetical protein
MNHYVRLLDETNKGLGRKCGVSHSQIHMARFRNVGPDNAEKIASHIASRLRLSEGERLELKAEIMSYPGELVRAYFGSPRRAAEILGVHEGVAAEILNPEKSITHKPGSLALKRLREIGAPELAIESVDRRLMPSPEPRRGLITFSRSGPEMIAERRETRERFAREKPATAEAIAHSGLKIREIRERAGVGKETMRKALYMRCGKKAATSIAAVLAEELELSEERRETIREELMRGPQKTF